MCILNNNAYLWRCIITNLLISVKLSLYEVKLTNQSELYVTPWLWTFIIPSKYLLYLLISVWVTIMHLLRIRIIVTQTVQHHEPDRICILVHCDQWIRIIFTNMHYNHFFTRSLNPNSHYWSLSLRTETEKNSGMNCHHSFRKDALFRKSLNNVQLKYWTVVCTLTKAKHSRTEFTQGTKVFWVTITCPTNRRGFCNKYNYQGVKIHFGDSFRVVLETSHLA